MNSSNPRLERLKALVSMEERRVAIQEELESLSQKMNSLRDSLFAEGAAALAEPSRARVSTTSQAKSSPAPRSRQVASPTQRTPRGALKEQIVAALHAAGSAGVRVTELAKAFGMKPVNIHSWFHSSIKRYPQIKQIKGGHYRLEGKLDGEVSRQPVSRKTAKSTGGKPAAAKVSGPARKGAPSGTPRGALSEKVLGELRKAGAKGVSVREIANRIGANYRNIYIWFATTGKKNRAVKKIAPAQYRLIS
jgi:hypothetical protein